MFPYYGMSPIKHRELIGNINAIFFDRNGEDIMTDLSLKPGRPVPLFQAMNMSGKAVALADYKGRRLLLSFFRYAS